MAKSKYKSDGAELTERVDGCQNCDGPDHLHWKRAMNSIIADADYATHAKIIMVAAFVSLVLVLLANAMF
jgi:hypothetical protein